MYTEDWSILLCNEFYGASSLEDVGLTVTSQVVTNFNDVVAALFCLGRGKTDRGNLRLGVSNARNAVVVDRTRIQTCDLLCDQNSFGEANVGKLKSRNQIADSPDSRNVSAALVINDQIATIHRDASFLVSKVC